MSTEILGSTYNYQFIQPGPALVWNSANLGPSIREAFTLKGTDNNEGSLYYFNYFPDEPTIIENKYIRVLTKTTKDVNVTVKKKVTESGYIPGRTRDVMKDVQEKQTVPVDGFVPISSVYFDTTTKLPAYNPDGKIKTQPGATPVLLRDIYMNSGNGGATLNTVYKLTVGTNFTGGKKGKSRTKRGKKSKKNKTRASKK
jgi:hypothetical protein